MCGGLVFGARMWWRWFVHMMLVGPSAPTRVCLGVLLFGGLVGSLGIVALVAQGYSALSVGFALVYIIPICTLGVVKIIKSW